MFLMVANNHMQYKSKKCKLSLFTLTKSEITLDIHILLTQLYYAIERSFLIYEFFFSLS